MRLIGATLRGGEGSQACMVVVVRVLQVRGSSQACLKVGLWRKCAELGACGLVDAALHLRPGDGCSMQAAVADLLRSSSWLAVWSVAWIALMWKRYDRRR